MTGVYYQAFSIEALHIADLGLGLSLKPPSPIPSRIEAAGTLAIGKDCYLEDPVTRVVEKNLAPDAVCLAATVAFGYNAVDPGQTYFSASIDAITIGELIVIFAPGGTGKAVADALPGTVANSGISGFEPGTPAAMSYAAALGGALTITNTRIPSGLRLSGRINLLGLEAAIEMIAVPPIGLYFHAVLPPVDLVVFTMTTGYDDGCSPKVPRINDEIYDEAKAFCSATPRGDTEADCESAVESVWTASSLISGTAATYEFPELKTSGRFVKISHPTAALALNEIRIGTVAVESIDIVSATMSAEHESGSSQFCADGIATAENVCQTEPPDGAHEAWIMVDLGTQQTIDTITVTARVGDLAGAKITVLTMRSIECEWHDTSKEGPHLLIDVGLGGESPAAAAGQFATSLGAGVVDVGALTKSVQFKISASGKITWWKAEAKAILEINKEFMMFTVELKNAFGIPSLDASLYAAMTYDSLANIGGRFIAKMQLGNIIGEVVGSLRSMLEPILDAVEVLTAGLLKELAKLVKIIKSTLDNAVVDDSVPLAGLLTKYVLTPLSLAKDMADTMVAGLGIAGVDTVEDLLLFMVAEVADLAGALASMNAAAESGESAGKSPYEGIDMLTREDMVGKPVPGFSEALVDDFIAKIPARPVSNRTFGDGWLPTMSMTFDTEFGPQGASVAFDAELQWDLFNVDAAFSFSVSTEVTHAEFITAIATEILKYALPFVDVLTDLYSTMKGWFETAFNDFKKLAEFECDPGCQSFIKGIWADVQVVADTAADVVRTVVSPPIEANRVIVNAAAGAAGTAADLIAGLADTMQSEIGAIGVAGVTAADFPPFSTILGQVSTQQNRLVQVFQVGSGHLETAAGALESLAGGVSAALDELRLPDLTNVAIEWDVTSGFSIVLTLAGGNGSGATVLTIALTWDRRHLARRQVVAQHRSRRSLSTDLFELVLTSLAPAYETVQEWQGGATDVLDDIMAPVTAFVDVVTAVQTAVGGKIVQRRNCWCKDDDREYVEGLCLPKSLGTAALQCDPAPSCSGNGCQGYTCEGRLCACLLCEGCIPEIPRSCIPGIPVCTPAIPEACTPAIPKSCIPEVKTCTPAIPKSCTGGTSRKCTKKFGIKVCTPGTPSVCTPAVPEKCTTITPEVCTPAVPEACIPAVPESCTATPEVCTPAVPEVCPLPGSTTRTCGCRAGYKDVGLFCQENILPNANTGCDAARSGFTCASEPLLEKWCVLDPSTL
jgi:hypothetical protein